MYYKKCGRTSQSINKRLANLQTSLLENCKIISVTDVLIDTYFFEYLLKHILRNYRPRLDREFYDINCNKINEIFECFNQINLILNTEEKLNEYIKNNYPEYFNKKRKRSTESCSSDDKPKRKRSYESGSSSDKLKNKKRCLFVDTSY